MKTNRLMSTKYIYRIDSVRCHNIVLIIKLLLQWHHPFKWVSAFWATCISPPPRLFHHRVLWNTIFSFFLWSLSPFLAFISHFLYPLTRVFFSLPSTCPNHTKMSKHTQVNGATETLSYIRWAPCTALQVHCLNKQLGLI